MAGIVIKPFGGGTFGLGGKADRTADLKQHVRHGRAQPVNHLVKPIEIFGAGAVGFADVEVQHGRAGIIAINSLLDLLGKADRNVIAVLRHKAGRIWRDLNDERILIFRKQTFVEKLHDLSPVLDGPRP